MSQKLYVPERNLAVRKVSRQSPGERQISVSHVGSGAVPGSSGSAATSEVLTKDWFIF